MDSKVSTQVAQILVHGKPKYKVHNTVGSQNIKERDCKTLKNFQYVCLLPGTKELKMRLRQNKGLFIVSLDHHIIDFFVQG